MRYSIYIFQAGLLFSLICSSPAWAGGVFDSPLHAAPAGELRSYFGDGRNAFGRLSYSSLAYDDALLPSGVRSGLRYSYTQRAGGAFLHMSLRDGASGRHRLAGGTFGKLDFSFQHGGGDGLQTARSGLNGISSNFFHGAASRPYQYSGASFAYPLTDRLGSHGGTLSIQAPNVDSRAVRFGGISIGNFAGTFYQVERGRPVARGISLAWRWRPFSLRYDELDSNYGATWRQVGAAYQDRKGGTLALTLSSGKNDAYRDANESRVSVSYRISFGGGRRGAGGRGGLAFARDPVAYHTGRSFDILSNMALDALNVGLVMTSGNPVLDQAARFPTQLNAAFNVLYTWNPISVRDAVEYGGAIYRQPDGTFSPSDIVVRGTANQVVFNPHALVPPGTFATADWHTHGAPDPRYLGEQFSTTDIQSYNYNRVDGYLGTPEGRMFEYQLATSTIVQYVGPDGNELILPH